MPPISLRRLARHGAGLAHSSVFPSSFTRLQRWQSTSAVVEAKATPITPKSLPSSVSSLLAWEPPTPTETTIPSISVNGWVRSVRSQKHHHFVTLGDGSSLSPLQALISADLAEGLIIGAAVRLTGSWVQSPAKGQSHELRVEKVEVLGPSDAQTFPVQKKYQTPEYLRTMPHLRARTPFNSLMLRFRSHAISTITQHFTSRDFTQTHPPLITSSDCEGAGETFVVSTKTLSPPPPPKPAGQLRPVYPSDNNTPWPLRPSHFFRAPKYLTVSSQLHLEALAQAVGNVWTLSPTFRAEKSDTARHLAEFYMLEAEMEFVDDMEVVMNEVQDMLSALTTSLYPSQLGKEIRARSGAKGVGDDMVSTEAVEKRWVGMMEQGQWPRITYTDAVKLLNSPEGREKLGDGVKPPTWGEALRSEHERVIAAVVGGGSHVPAFVTRYPRDIKAFYMRESPSSDTATSDAAMEGQDTVEEGQQGKKDYGDCRAVVDCFDLLVPQFCEIAGGSMREHRLGHLLDMMRKRGMVTPRDGHEATEGPGAAGGSTGVGGQGAMASNLGWYVDLRRWGCPPHGGFGLGFDRLLCYLAGMESVKDVAAFPRWYGRCDC